MRLSVSRCLCFGSLCHPSVAPQPCQPFRVCSFGIEIPFLGHACHLGTEQSLLRLPSKLNKVTLGRFWNSAHHLINTRKCLQLPRETGSYHCVLVLCVARGMSKPHSPPAPSAVSLVGSSFKSVLRLVFQPEVVASLSVPLSGACCPARAGQENVV